MRFTAVFLSVFHIVLLTVLLCGSSSHAAPPTSAGPQEKPSIDLHPPPPEDVTPAPAAEPPTAASVATPAPVSASPEIAATPLPPSTLTSAFQSGLAAFQKGDFKTARLWFREVLAKDATQIVAWYDLGLTEQRLGNAGLAMAFWRKALALSPTFSTAKHALSYTRSKLEHGDIPHDVETWETLRSSVLVYASTAQFAFLALFAFFIAAWLSFTYVGARRRALLDEKPLPAFPVLASLASVVFIGLLFLTICKSIDSADLRATVIAKKIEAKALPDSSSTPLFDLYEGLEVIVRQTRKDWVQVTYPGGATGWIPREALFTMNERVGP
jgi:hypothetical protein